ncbi:MAG TPA: hypothetical protein VLT47_11050 [Anaeromyxobacteraceae bacterium]|nr:hypothetical protein [Anaeromyxobacteraceae bacterium]
MQIADTIRLLLASEPWSSMSPWEINCGGCEDFQQAILAAAGLDGRKAERCTGNLPEEVAMWLPGHCWIFHDGRHFDAECPDGVTRAEDLPIFRRIARRS